MVAVVGHQTGGEEFALDDGREMEGSLLAPIGHADRDVAFPGVEAEAAVGFPVVGGGDGEGGAFEVFGTVLAFLPAEPAVAELEAHFLARLGSHHQNPGAEVEEYPGPPGRHRAGAGDEDLGVL